MSVSTDSAPGIKRQVSRRLRGIFESAREVKRVSIVAAEALPRTRAKGDSRRLSPSVAPDKQRRAAALARTRGKCLWRASMTSTESRKLSRAVSANARLVLAARRKKSGDVAILWNSGKRLHISVTTIYTPNVLQAYTRSTHMRESRSLAARGLDVGYSWGGGWRRCCMIGYRACLGGGGIRIEEDH